MYAVLLILHVALGLAMIGVILIQTGKGADIGAAFGGGSSQTVFGGRGPTTFLHRLTTAIAALFMATYVANSEGFISIGDSGYFSAIELNWASLSRKASTTSGSRWLPRPSIIIFLTFSCGNAGLYTRAQLNASKTSARAINRPACRPLYPQRVKSCAISFVSSWVLNGLLR